MFWLICALVLERLHLIIAGPNHGTPFNGVGCVDNVLNRTALAPMCYRVLVPWLIGLAEWTAPSLKPHRMVVYSAVRTILVWLALWACERAIGFQGALIVACLLPMTVQFDYWDFAPELAGLALALTGDFRLALIGSVICAFSRETSLLCPLVYLLMAGKAPLSLVILASVLLCMFVIRIIQGERELYCERIMVKRNWRELKAALGSPFFYIQGSFMSLIVAALTLWACWRRAESWPAALALLMLGWCCGVAAETRIFSGCLLWIAMVFTNQLTK